jgi:glycosyltransferase involved in cell wall biosynthesis
VRILVDYRPALRERTGVGEYVHELTKALASQAGRDLNDQIALFTSSWKDRPEPTLASQMPSPVRIVDMKVPVRALAWAWNRLEWPPVEWFAGESDVVHSQSPLLIPTTNAAQVVTVHDLDFLRHPEQMTAEIRRDYPALARSHASRAHAVIVSSQYAAGEVTSELRLEPSRVHVCPPGRPSWSDEVRQRRASRAPKHILFLGTLNLRKNVGTLLEAYAHVRERRPDALPLVLAGHRTPASARWEERCAQAPLAGHVQVTGYVDTAKRIDLYTHAAMLVLPSYEEGFGLPVLEAMACGVPVIVSSRGSLPEVAGPAATPIDPDDADAFAREMQAVLDGDVRERVTKGLAQAATYSWTACAAAARRAYQAAIEVRLHSASARQVHARRH